MNDSKRMGSSTRSTRFKLIAYRLLVGLTIFYGFSLFAQKESKLTHVTTTPSPRYQFDSDTLLIVTHAFGYPQSQEDAAKSLIKKVLDHQGKVFLNYDPERDKGLIEFLKASHPTFVTSGKLFFNISHLGEMCEDNYVNIDILVDLGKKLDLHQGTNIYLIGNLLDCCLSASLAYALGAVHFSNLNPLPDIHIDLDLSNDAFGNLSGEGILDLERYQATVTSDLKQFFKDLKPLVKKSIRNIRIQYYNPDGTYSREVRIQAEPTDVIPKLVQLFYSGLGQSK